MASPQLLIIPGSYTSALAYYDFRDILRRKHPELPEALVYDLPSASSGPPLPPPTLYDDGEFFAGKIAELADHGVDIVLLAHSYGGLAAREALKGLSKAERMSQGKKGGIVRIIYLASVICEAGQSSMDILADNKVDSIDVYHKDYARQDIEKAAAAVFSDLPQREAVRHAARLTVHTLVSFTNPSTELSVGDMQIPSTYIFTTKDKILPPDFQRERIEILKTESGEDNVQVVEMETGHFPIASAPEKVAEEVEKILMSV